MRDFRTTISGETYMTTKVASKPIKGRTIKPTKPTENKPENKTENKPTIGRVFFDYSQRKLGVQYQGDAGAYGPPSYVDRIALRKVKPTIIDNGPGSMAGNMGFLVGEVSSETARLTCKDVALVGWNGHKFYTIHDEATVNQMATCFVVNVAGEPYIVANGINQRSTL